MDTFIGVGTDVLEISRIREIYGNWGEQWLNKCFTGKEQQYCLKFRDPVLHFAGRFCAKESLAKALGTGLGSAVSFLDFEILNNSEGKPEVLLSENFQKQFPRTRFLLSISHTETVALATAICLEN